MKIPATHKLTPLETKLLHALQKALRDNVFFVANGIYWPERSDHVGTGR